MTISATRRASAKGTQTRPTQFSSKIVALENVLVLALQYDQTKTTIVEDSLYLLTVPSATGSTFGYNSQMYVGHLMAYSVHGGSVKTYALPIAEPATASASTGSVVFGGSPTENGTVVYYCNGKRKAFSVAASATPTAIGDLFDTSLNGANDTLLTSVNTTGTCATTATFSGTTGDNIRLLGAYKNDDPDLPAGLTMTITQASGGGGDETTSLTSALAAFAADPEWKTDIVTPTNNAATLDAALAVIGLPDVAGAGTGLWSDTDYRPATNWVALIDAYSTCKALSTGTGRKSDPNSCIVCAPDRAEMPFEIACAAAAYVGLSANSNAATKYADNQLSAVGGPVDSANDWTGGTNGSNQRDTALKDGLTTIYLDSDGVSTFGDVATTYKPDEFAFPPFEFEVNKRKTWNIAKTVKDDKLAFKNDVIVEAVNEATDQPLATDEDTEAGRIAALANGWQRFGWAYNSLFTVQNMVVKQSDSNPDRFDRAIPVILSANKRVESDTVLVDRDTSIAQRADIVIKIG
jgi:phage tail sheath gpL-like